MPGLTTTRQWPLIPWEHGRIGTEKEAEGAQLQPAASVCSLFNLGLHQIPHLETFPSFTKAVHLKDKFSCWANDHFHI